jgi:Oxaloacetate decarboxylase, gamma chain.
MNPGIIVNMLAAASVTQSDLPLSDRLIVGFEVTGIGLLTVFVVLMLLWGILELFRIVFDRKPKNIPVVQDEEPQETGDNTDAALVAAITAAVSAYADKPASQLRVVRFQKK